MADLALFSWLRFIVGNRLAPFVGTPPHVCAALLRLAAVTKADTVFDAGAGDGRLLLHAWKQHGARGEGFELDEELCARARRSFEDEQAPLRIHCADALSADYAPATIVTAYLSETGNAKLLPFLQEAAGRQRAAGLAAKRVAEPLRLVTFSFPVAGLTPVNTMRVDGIDLYLYKL